MGFALWIDGELAWAKGTHEYRPMGTAVIAATDLFAQRDFSPGRRAPKTTDAGFVGLFASLGHVNVQLERTRSGRERKRVKKKGAAGGGASISI